MTAAARKVPTKVKDPIQVVMVEVRKEHLDKMPCDWPRKLMIHFKEIVLRPFSDRSRPASVEILAPASVVRSLRKDIGERFVLTVTSTGYRP